MWLFSLGKDQRLAVKLLHGEMNTIYYKNRIKQFLVPKQSFGLEMSSNAFDDKNVKSKLAKPTSWPAGFMTCMHRTRKP